VSIEMNIGVLEGSATALKIGRLRLDGAGDSEGIQDVNRVLGPMEVKQKIGIVTKTGFATAVEIGSVERGSQRTKTESDDVS
jgi:hypothetical protein